jgi:hypothetical protein
LLQKEWAKADEKFWSSKVGAKFVILNSYAIDSSSLSLGYALESAMFDLDGEVSVGELCLLEKSNNRVIPLSNTAIWENL